MSERVFFEGKPRKCTICGKEKILNRDNFNLHRQSTSGFMPQCRDCRKIYKKQYNFQHKNGQRLQRKKVLEHYGNKCVCCGEETYEFLSLDHINDDGFLDRKKNQNCAAPWRILKSSIFPENLQILCYNCNMAKAFSGGCPHKK